MTELDILMGRDKEYPLDASMKNNLQVLTKKVAELETLYGKPFVLTSGYRPGRYNAAVGGSPKSSHMTCQAVDISDRDGKLKEWCVKNIEVLNKLGLYMEDPAKTKTWIHLQIRKTKNNPFRV
jgi:uncharacterized protein YcbK (DUF882 family)